MTRGPRALRTQVGIVGAGPAGLLLAHLLQLEGIESTVLEVRSRDHVEQRIRAGVLEQGTVDLLTEAGVAERLLREGLVHRGIELRFSGRGHRIPLSELADGRAITIYGQQEVVKDLIQARLATDGPLLFEVDRLSVDGLSSNRPRIAFAHAGESIELGCDFVAGCDGFHGVCRDSIPAGVLASFARDYPFGWLGILAAASPSSDELVYAHHERGFALQSLRSPELSRLYLQCAADEDLSQWSDDRIWDELHTRLALDGSPVNEGPILERGVTAMRGFVVEPMQFGRLFLAGDAAHRPADGRQGPQPRRPRRRGPRRGARRLVPPARRVAPRRVLERPAPARMARRSLLVVDDLVAAPAPGRRVRGQAPARPARIRVLLARGRDLARRELRRALAENRLSGRERRVRRRHAAVDRA